MTSETIVFVLTLNREVLNVFGAHETALAEAERIMEESRSLIWRSIGRKDRWWSQRGRLEIERWIVR